MSSSVTYWVTKVKRLHLHIAFQNLSEPQEDGAKPLVAPAIRQSFFKGELSLR